MDEWNCRRTNGPEQGRVASFEANATGLPRGQQPSAVQEGACMGGGDAAAAQPGVCHPGVHACTFEAWLNFCAACLHADCGCWCRDPDGHHAGEEATALMFQIALNMYKYHSALAAAEEGPGSWRQRSSPPGTMCQDE